MDQNINHFANLVNLSYADDHLHPDELAFLYKVAKRLNIEDSLVQEFIKNPPKQKFALPTDEVKKYIYLDDMLNLISVDGEIHPGEIELTKKLAKELGFEDAIIDSIIAKIRSHFKKGYDKNISSDIIKFDIYSMTQKSEKYERYNK